MEKEQMTPERLNSIMVRLKFKGQLIKECTDQSLNSIMVRLKCDKKRRGLTNPSNVSIPLWFD